MCLFHEKELHNPHNQMRSQKSFHVENKGHTSSINAIQRTWKARPRKKTRQDHKGEPEASPRERESALLMVCPSVFLALPSVSTRPRNPPVMSLYQIQLSRGQLLRRRREKSSFDLTSGATRWTNARINKKLISQ